MMDNEPLSDEERRKILDDLRNAFQQGRQIETVQGLSFAFVLMVVTAFTMVAAAGLIKLINWLC